METKAEYKISNVCTDELTELILDVQDAGYELGVTSEQGVGGASAQKRAPVARANLREYFASQLADAHEVAESLRHVVDAKDQTIAAMQARIDALESDMRELQE